MRDGWPQISDAVVDYYGARKLAYAVIKRIQQDVCVMIDEPKDGQHAVVAVNDTLRPVALEATVRNGPRSLLQKTTAIPANGKVHLGMVLPSPTTAFYTIDWTIDTQTGHNHYLAGPRPFEVSACRAWYTGALQPT